MSQTGPTPDQVAPLLLELARAFRARQFYPATHPALREVLERTGSVWTEALGEIGELHLELRQGLFTIEGGAAVQGPGIDEVAQELGRRRAKRLRIHPGVSPPELEALVDALSGCEPSETDADGLEATLERAGVRRITTREIDLADRLARPGAREERERPVPAPPEPGGSELPEESRERAGGGIEADGAPSGVRDLSQQLAEPPGAPAPGSEQAESGPRDAGAGDEGGPMAGILEELEACDEPGSYNSVALRLLDCAERLMLERDYSAVYRGALAFARHVLDTGSRPPLFREIARDRLGQLLRSDEMLAFVLEGTGSASAIGNLKATEVLLCVGAPIVPRLLEVHTTSDTDIRSHISSVLIVMGDVAFPVLVEELGSGNGARLRRAARILGEMQHPRGVEFLAEHLRNPDAHVKKEVAMALTRIGTKRAFEHLMRALQGDAATAQIAAASLGNVRGDATLSALISVVEPGGERPDELRREAIRSLGRIGRREATPTLSRVLERTRWVGRKRNRALRVAAAHALGRIGGPEAEAALARYARRGDPPVRRACGEALQLLTRMAGA
jgi:HEAT repeat protein